MLRSYDAPFEFNRPTIPSGIIPIGRASVHAHHGELVQGRFRFRGRLIDALVTLPIAGKGSAATFFPVADSASIKVIPPSRKKAQRAARIALEYLGVCSGGTLVIDSSIPLKWGMGSSTADVVAAVKAVAEATGHRLMESEIAALAVRAEGASDPIMMSAKPCLFAHRDGFVVEILEGAAPAFVVMSVVAHELASGLDTLSLPKIEYTDQEIDLFDAGIATLREAYRSGNLPAIGAVATRSASINQKYRPKPLFDELVEISHRAGALGVQVAHSGSVVGLLFRQPFTSKDLTNIEHALDEISNLNVHDVQLFGL
ncbi:L-threonine kinase [Pandoraea horticolens]|uniref:L-threonine kinase n=1 Tax=Pandoraea horticolens TaxID=2508298 RepID=A0A5E4ZE05_9BURK|nr:kinase [Pandoraea horticolens]VVE58917.1 L-threonine kinase [Pandoraea horticolens]